jgi:hypothetical protein
MITIHNPLNHLQMVGILKIKRRIRALNMYDKHNVMLNIYKYSLNEKYIIVYYLINLPYKTKRLQ